MYDEDEDYEEFESLYSQEVVEDQVQVVPTLYDHCLIPTLNSIGNYLLQLLVCCLLFRLVSQLVIIPRILCHVASASLGLYALVYYFKGLVVDVLILVAAAYLVLAVLNALEMNHGPIVGLLSLAYLVTNEFFLESESWQKIRGPEMLIVMKVVSIAFDLDSGVLQRMPTVWEYSGYVMCVGTSVFGVWCSFLDYQAIFLNPIWNVKWLLKICRSLSLSLLSFIFSVCLIEYFIPPDSSTWWGMYRDALQFRTSHYFVSYLSEAAAVLSGFGSQPNGNWVLNVADPRYIELPYSLVQVVVNWNKYMHKWLKIYVFRTTRMYGSLVAILATYAVSSLLHGLNLPLATILMSLGAYTYTEYSMRYLLSVGLSACVAARPCPRRCTRHVRTTRLLPVALCNWLWSLLAMFHLAYLGCIIDTSDSRPPPFLKAIQKWSDVHYISHWITFFTYFLYFCIK